MPIHDADFSVRVVTDPADADSSVFVVNGEIVDLSGASDGDVITVQPDGSLAAEALPASGPSQAAFDDHSARHEVGGADALTTYAPLASVFEVTALGKAVSNTNFASFVLSNARYFGFGRQSTDAIDNQIVFRLPSPLLGGTWTLVLVHSQSSNRPIYTFDLSTDGAAWTSAVATIDGYAASLTHTRTEVTGVTVPAATAFVRIRNASKNASSTGYVGEIQDIAGLRTGA